jgi:hypothetical protein
MIEPQQIVNPDFQQVFIPAIAGINMIQCNKSSDVYKFIRTGGKYVIEIPDIKTILNVECTYAAIRAADMRIISEYINGKKCSDNSNCTISYQYEQFDTIHYSSFDYREKCKLYISVDNLF